MSEADELPALPGFITIAEAARRMDLNYRTVYRYITNGQMKGYKVNSVTLVPEEEVNNFKRKLTGKPRTSIPQWRISPPENYLWQTTIFVEIQKSQLEQFKMRLEEIRDAKTHLFPGTIARYITESKNRPHTVEITLIWRGAAMPDKNALEATLEDFRKDTVDVLDWKTAEYDEGIVWMHT